MGNIDDKSYLYLWIVYVIFFVYFRIVIFVQKAIMHNSIFIDFSQYINKLLMHFRYKIHYQW